MQPVYLCLSYKGQRKITRISKIHGDIWKLEQELKEFLEKRMEKQMYTQIHEFAGTLKIKGDCVNRVKEWMDIKGF